MTARDLISPTGHTSLPGTLRHVPADMPVFDVLPRLLDTPQRMLAVTDGRGTVGIIDTDSLLAGLGALIAPRDDSSVIVISCHPSDYSASMIANAVEDADAHLVDLISTPMPEGMLRVTLRIRHSDPSATVRSLERYGFNVTGAHGASYADARIADERIAALQTYLNV